MGRRYVHPVHQLEVVVAQGGARLWEQQHIAIAYAGHGHAVAPRQQTAWCLAVVALHLLVFLLRHHLGGPCLILFLGEPQRMALAHVRLLCPPCIRAQHNALGLYLSGKSLERRRQPVHVVAFGTQSFQEVIHRWYHLHAAGQQGILSRALEVADGDAFLLVPLGAKGHVPLHVVHQCPAALHLGSTPVIPLGVFVLCADAVGRHAAVNLGNHDARVLRSRGHGLVLVHPLVMRHRQGEWRKQRNVVLVEPVHQRVVAQPSHGHIDHGVGFQFHHHVLAPFADGCQRIHIKALLREQRDERVHMLAVALHGEGHARDERQPRSPLVVEVVGAQIVCQFVGMLEVMAVSPVIEHVFHQVHRLAVFLVAPA